MYNAHPGAADSATINPAALNSPDPTGQSQHSRKRSRSPGFHDVTRPGDDADSPKQSRKRIRPMKPHTSRSVSDAPGQAPPSAMPQTIPPLQTTQPQDSPLPQSSSNPSYGAGAAPAPAPAPASAPAPGPVQKTPTKSTLKALPTVRDHTTDQLQATGDEYIPREIDEFGEKKVMANGTLLGNRQYRCRTFLVPDRGDKLFMLATECARVLGYRDSYLLFNKNRSLYKIIASQNEKDDLVNQEILPFSYRSRQIAIVTARSMFRQFGSRVIENGRRVRDDYWETKARKQGFTEADPAGEKRPGAARAREQAAAEAQNNALLTNPHPEIVYSNTPGPYPPAPQHLVQPELDNTRPRDYGSIVRSGPRQEITGPPYQDQTRPAPIGELHSQAHHAADFNRSVNQQRDMRSDYLQSLWRRPHEQPPPAGLSQPLAPSDTTVPTTRPTSSPHTAATGISQPNVVASQSPQMVMTAAPYSQTIHSQSGVGQGPLRGSTAGMPQGTPGYNYQQSNPAMWSQSPQTPQHGYGSYTTQTQPPQPSQSPTHLRQPGQMQPNMQFPAMGGMQYSGQSMYGAEQTPRQYMSQGGSGGPAVSQAWSGQHSPPQQWWAQQPQ